MNAEKLRGMFGGQTKGNIPNVMGGGKAGPQINQNSVNEMPNKNEMAAMMGAMKGPEADMMKSMLELMQKGDPQL